MVAEYIVQLTYPDGSKEYHSTDSYREAVGIGQEHLDDYVQGESDFEIFQNVKFIPVRRVTK